MDENNEISLLNKLKNIKEEIKQSWYKDCDRTKDMIEFTEMLKEMQTKESLEEYFSNDEQTLTEFKGEILQEIIGFDKILRNNDYFDLYWLLIDK